jgi:hypothetical protein
MDVYDEEGNVIHIEERKNGLWQKIGGGSLMFAALFHVVLLIIGAFWIFQIITEPEKKVDFMPPGGGGGERSADKVAVKKLKQITPTTNVKKVFAEGATSTYAIPEQGDNFGEMSTLSSLSGGGMSGGLGGSGNGNGFGRGSGNGNGLGMGGGAGKLFGLIPETMRKRCSKEDRLQRLKENGGTPACEEAVVKGLRWLKGQQQADGSWGGGSAPAMTGLALLAYFGHCETPISEEFGDSCMKGIIYLVNVGMKNDGKLASNFTANSWCYEHAIATYALGEAATFCKDLKIPVPYLDEVTEKAGQFIIDNQNKNGGWAYKYATDGGHTDTSIVGWQIQALKACSHTNISYKGMTSCINKGLKYLATMQNDSGGFGYSNPNAAAGGGKYFALTGVGVLCHQMWSKGNQSEARKGLKYIKDNTKFDWNGENSNLYAHYYESQAMMQSGGKDWEFYNALFRDQVVNNQNADGSWKATGHKMHGDNPVYRNCLAILMLEVYYRFLNSTGSGSSSSAKPIF